VSHLSPSRIILTLSLACALGALPACGGSAVDPDSGALGSTVNPTPTTAVATPTTKPRATKTLTPTPTPTADDGGDGDDIGDDEPVTAGGGVCGHLTANDLGAIIGDSVKAAGLSGGGCVFNHADRRAPEATIKDESYAGMDAAKTEATSAVEGEPEDLSGIGSAAFVVTGSIFGGTEIQGAGAVHVGSRTISVSLVQHKAMSRAAVRSMVVKLLQLVARKAS
jgi:hypothetical protein